MSPEERRYGTVPSSRRRLFALALLVIGGVVIAAGIVISVATGTGVRWAWLAIAAGGVMAIYAIYLWIRLSD